jgi:hypothetical protein
MELGKGGNGFWGRRYKGGGWDFGEEARLLWEELSEFFSLRKCKGFSKKIKKMQGDTIYPKKSMDARKYIN